jgi:hypothetical protein
MTVSGVLFSDWELLRGATQEYSQDSVDLANELHPDWQGRLRDGAAKLQLSVHLSSKIHLA